MCLQQINRDAGLSGSSAIANAYSIAVDKISTNSASSGPCAMAELLDIRDIKLCK